MSSWISTDAWTVGTVLAVGLCLGSFLNVVIHRLPLGQSLVRPRSRCGRCGSPVRWYHNVPVLGWIVLGGRCADCGSGIALRYPLVEILGAGLTVLAVFGFSRPIESAAAIWLFLSLLVVFFIDLDHRIIPDEISLGGTALGLILSPWTVGWSEALLAAALGSGGLFLIGWVYERARGRAGMGLGDVKLAAMLGAFLGVPGLVVTILLASFLGAATGIGLIAVGRGGGGTALPFGSFLAPAAMAAFVWGPLFWSWYLGFFPQG